MNEYKEKIDSYLDSKKEEMLEDLKTLVRINSQKGAAKEGMPFGEGPAAALSAARQMMEQYGLCVRNYENYVVTGDLKATDQTGEYQRSDGCICSMDGFSLRLNDSASKVVLQPEEKEGNGAADSQKGLDILAHLDVVPVTEDWTVTQPFEPKIVEDRIYGRGTADDKGPAIAALYALRAIRELAIPMKKGVRLILGSDEECGSGDLKYYYGIEKEAPYTFTPDADFPVINIEKGRLEARFHTEYGDTGSTASETAMQAEKDAQKSQAALADTGASRGMASGRRASGVRVLSLKSGDKANVVPGRAVLVLEGLSETIVRQASDETTNETGVIFEIEKLDDGGFGSGNHSAENLLLVNARGQAAHASTPQEGKNALTATLRLIKKLAAEKVFSCDGADAAGLDVLLALERLFPYEDTCGKTLGIYREEEQSGAVTLCFSILDYQPGHVCGAFDARLPIGCDEENTKQPVMKAFAENGIQMEDVPMTRPHCVPGDSDFVRILLDSYETYTGIKGEPLSTGGGTYVHGLERGVAFGCMTPDVDNHMHGDDEFMVIDTLMMSAKIFADAIIRICNEL
ncbi:MAG: M20/M25/M40 family metallo-hydrolase [Lachnospiraceae bacterium]|nr:M20/M25/M40 family metallo-hydrolase [Lachnospiraceae bacterium]